MYYRGAQAALVVYDITNDVTPSLLLSSLSSPVLGLMA
jgi:GTPase SAR1 family protein